MTRKAIKRHQKQKHKNTKINRYNRRKTIKELSETEVPRGSLVGEVAYPLAEGYGMTKKGAGKATKTVVQTTGGIGREAGRAVLGSGATIKSGYLSAQQPISNAGMIFRQRTDNWRARRIAAAKRKQDILATKHEAKVAQAVAKAEQQKEAAKNPGFKNWARRNIYAGKINPETGQKQGRVAAWFGRRAEKAPGTLYKGKGVAFTGLSKGLGFGTRNIQRTGVALGQIGGAVSSAAAQSFSPIQIFQLAWAKMSTTIKWLIVLVFTFVILFVPWGIFYYTGWAVGAAFMFLISLIYWVFASFFNAIAYGIVSLINGVVSIFMGLVIWIVEFILGIIMKPNYYNPNSGKYEYYWENGHALFNASLLKYSDVASVPTLMIPITPKWEGWMNNILIVKLIEHIPGLQPIINAFGVIGSAMGNTFQNVITHSDPWVVMFIGFLPIIIIAAIFIAIYLKYRNEFQ